VLDSGFRAATHASRCDATPTNPCAPASTRLRLCWTGRARRPIRVQARRPRQAPALERRTRAKQLRCYLSNRDRTEPACNRFARWSFDRGSSTEPVFGQQWVRLWDGQEASIFSVTSEGLQPASRNFARLVHQGNFLGAWSGLLYGPILMAFVTLLATGQRLFGQREIRSYTKRRQRAHSLT